MTWDGRGLSLRKKPRPNRAFHGCLQGSRPHKWDAWVQLTPTLKMRTCKICKRVNYKNGTGTGYQ